jgi:ribonuclease HII
MNSDPAYLASISITEIRGLVDSDDVDDSFLDALRDDPRAGVRALAKKIERGRERQAHESSRLAVLSAPEEEIRKSGFTIIAGVDEVGRGPLAGPVVAGAVILPAGAELPGVDDSKKLTAEKRESLFGLITDIALGWGIGMIDNEEIDATSIVDATHSAMRTAIANLGVKPDIVLVDGTRAPGSGCRERTVVNGDARCISIAAASVVAKVTRDRLMRDLDSRFPAYGFAGHKGYGAASHVAALREHGPCPLHRCSFKIVPRVSPPGTTAAVLADRFRMAATKREIDRTAAAVSKLSEYLTEIELASLREKYRMRARALGA